MNNYESQKAAVRDLCKRMGYGAVMQLAETCWREDVPSGVPGAEHTVGPCAAFLVKCDHNGVPGYECDWCCGSERVTKRVFQAMREAPAAKGRGSRRGRRRAP